MNYNNNQNCGMVESKLIKENEGEPGSVVNLTEIEVESRFND